MSALPHPDRFTRPSRTAQALVVTGTPAPSSLSRRLDSSAAVASPNPSQTATTNPVPATPDSLGRPSVNPNPRATTAATTYPAAALPKAPRGILQEVLALHGQVPANVEMVPQTRSTQSDATTSSPGTPTQPQPRPAPEPTLPAAPSLAPVISQPQAATPTGLAAPSPSAKGAAIRILSTHSADRDPVAFSMRLQDTESTPASAGTAALETTAPGTEPKIAAASTPAPPPDPAPAPKAAAASRAPAAPEVTTAENPPAPPQAADPHTASSLRDQAPPDRPRRSEPEPADRLATPAPAAAEAPGMRTAAHSTEFAPAPPPAPPDRAAAKAEPATHTAAPPELKPEAPKTLPAHDIKLEVSAADGRSDSRVEVRLSERGGEVKVAVRTADGGLASSLRDNLPALASKLSDSGFKTDTWRQGAASGEWLRHTTETAAGNSAQDSDPQSRQQDQGQQQQQDPDQRRPKSSQQSNQQDQKGRDFAWLMSTLR